VLTSNVKENILFRNNIHSKEEKQLTDALQELHFYFWFEKTMINTLQKQYLILATTVLK
ncbi:5104_t:CDS:1, partial [Dentiscutata heterogama]